MQFHLIKDDYYSILIDRLKSIVPDFDTLFDKGDGVYLVLGDFCQYLIANIDNENIINVCMNFINEALQNGKDKTEDAIVLEIFKPIYENLNPNIQEKIKSRLSEKGLTIFNNNNNLRSNIGL